MVKTIQILVRVKTNAISRAEKSALIFLLNLKKYLISYFIYDIILSESEEHRNGTLCLSVYAP